MRPVLFIFLILSSIAFSAEGPDRFGKCYKQFVGEIVSPDHPLLIKTKNSGMTGKEACKQLLTRANLSNGTLAFIDDETKSILHNFTVLHNSFFSGAPKKAGEEKYVYDRNDRSYYLLLTLFSTDSNGKPNYPFKNIFTDNNTYRAIRERKSYNGHLVARVDSPGTAVYEGVYPYALCGNGWNNWSSNNECSNFPYTYQKIDPRILEEAKIDVSSGVMRQIASSSRVRDEGELLSVGGHQFSGKHHALVTTRPWGWGLEDMSQQGEIVGVRPQGPRRVPHFWQRLFNSSDGYYRDYLGPAFEQPYPHPQNDFYDNLGAGILFTPSFQETLGLDSNQVNMQNGVDKVPRAWTQEIIQDFLCREIPVIRQGDAVPFIAEVRSDKAPFRNSASCMRCHATIDSLSFIARNYQYAKTSVVGGKNLKVNAFHAPTKSAESSLLTEPDSFFAVRPANGDFRYRDYMGDFHNIALSASASNPKASFQEFGEYLSNMNDPYICMTSKYFKYLTGIRPLLFDPGDESAPHLSQRDRAIQNYLFKLGRELREGRSARDVVLDIVSSDLYIDPDAEI